MNPLKHYIIPNWPATSNIKAYLTTRLNGHSQAPFDQLNLSFNAGDEKESVEKNRLQLMEELKLPEEPRWLKQVHSNHVISAEQWQTDIEADACHTDKNKKVCVVMFADCLPILLCNQQGTEIAAIHAGWRGLQSGVIDNTVKQLKSPSSELLAWYGPAIGPEHFEVNEQIRVDFLMSNPQNIDCFELRDGNRWFANIFKLARHNLERCGIKNIFGEDRCTFSESRYFYSHRRDQKVTGRMCGLIWIE